jgi:hypothetical protein
LPVISGESTAPELAAAGLEHIVVSPAALQALLIIIFSDHQFAYKLIRIIPGLLIFLSCQTTS